ncbi:MAG: class I SAM-dependent methyltransferase [Gemmatimonadetes bacterium]|nr:class I SAM-dependent methyltransferase [Gemmatimonadota bacterium]
MDDFYSDPRLYDLMFPPGPRAAFYAEEARRAGGPVLELACGTGQLLVPITRAGLRTVGLDLSPDMLRVARDRLRDAPVPGEVVEGDMRDFDLGESFALVFVARNSLLHLHATDDLLACFRSVRRHLEPGGVFVFDIFNPSVQRLAGPAGERFPVMRVDHPEHGEVTVEAEGEYDAAAQVKRETWYFSAPGRPDFRKATLAVRNIFPQELPLLLSVAGLRMEARYGNLLREPFQGNSAHQVCVCRAAP